MDQIIGQVTMFGGNFAPQGWAYCDGQLLAISQNEALFSILGTTYGGDGRTTFALPDLRGKVVMHPGTGPDLSQRKLGDTGGAEQVYMSVNEMPAHGHSINANTEANNVDPSGNYIAGTSEAKFSNTTDAQMNANSTTQIGGEQPINNIQPYGSANYIIAIYGVYPSRN